MSKIMKMAALTLVLILAVGSAVAAASDVNFTIQGSKWVFVFTPENTDLFQNFKGLMPGDSVEQQITVQNTGKYVTRIYLRADPVADEDRAFLDQLKMSVSVGKNKVFEAAPSLQGALAATEKEPYGILLGTFHDKGSVNINVSLDVPLEMGNAFMGQEAVVPWTFTAEEVVMPTTPETGDSFTLWVWLAAGGALAACLLWLIFGRKKQKEA